MNAKVIIALGVGLAIVGIVIGIGENQTPESVSDEELTSMSIPWDYEDILRNEEKYQGNMIHFSGKINTVHQKSDTDRYQLQVETDCKREFDTYNCDFFLVFHKGEIFLVGDKVQVFGIVNEVMDVKMIAGHTELVPIIEGIKVSCTSC